MKKVYLMKGMALAAVAVATVSCSRDLGGYDPRTQESQMANAEMQLGVQIDPNQDWKMTQTASATVAVGGDYGTDNKVTIYQNNPTIGNSGVVLGKATVKSGSEVSIDFTAPKGNTTIYIAVQDYKGYTYVQPAALVDGKAAISFGDGVTRGARRSATNSDVNIPTGASQTTVANQAAEILAKSVELTESNNNQNAVGYYWYNSDSDNGIVTYDNYVINFMISGEFEGEVKQLSSVGTKWSGNWTTNAWGGKEVEASYEPRTLYVKGKWVIPEGLSQSCGNGANVDIDGNGQYDDVDGIIVVGPDAEIEVNGTLNFNNMARLIVLPGGKVTGSGLVQVNNGSKVGEESYNYGTISVKQLNENFGNFFNYGTITSETLVGGAGTSCFVNHGTINIKQAYGNNNSAANLQIKNNCNFTAQGRVAAKIIENGANAYLEAGELAFSDGEGGECLGSYLGLDAGSRVYVAKRTGTNATTGDLYGNNASIVGPSSGNYAYLCVDGQVAQWNWTSFSEAPAVRHVGMIINHVNIYVGGGYANDNTADNFEQMLNETIIDTNKSWHNWGEKIGIGGATVLTTKDGFNTAATEDSDCAPAFTPADKDTIKVIKETYPIYSYAFEDTPEGDYDLNDVVIKVQQDENDTTKLNLKFVASGATLDLYVRLYNSNAVYGSKNANDFRVLSYKNKTEIHEMFGVEHGIMINTLHASGQKAEPFTIQVDKGSYDPSNLPIAIWSATWDEVDIAGAGDTPHGVVIPYDWKWPKERVHVTTAYAETETDETNPDQSFATFASDADGGADLWWKHPTRNVINEKTLGYE